MALVSACDKVIEKAKTIAAGMLEVSAGGLEWTPGRAGGIRPPAARSVTVIAGA